MPLGGRAVCERSGSGSATERAGQRRGDGAQAAVLLGVNGTTTWHPETVAGKGSTFSVPSMFLNNNAANITAVGAQDRLKYYWAVNGTTTWHPETVAGKGSVR